MKIIGFILNKNNSDLLEVAYNKIPKCINGVFISDDNSTDKSESVASKLKVNFSKINTRMVMEAMLKTLWILHLIILMQIMQ